MSEVAVESQGKPTYDGVTRPFTPPPEAVREIVSLLESWKAHNNDRRASFKLKKTRKGGHPYLKFGDFNQSFAACFYLADFNFWKRFNIQFVRKNSKVWLGFLPYREGCGQ